MKVNIILIFLFKTLRAAVENNNKETLLFTSVVLGKFAAISTEVNQASRKLLVSLSRNKEPFHYFYENCTL